MNQIFCLFLSISLALPGHTSKVKSLQKAHAVIEKSWNQSDDLSDLVQKLGLNSRARRSFLKLASQHKMNRQKLPRIRKTPKGFVIAESVRIDTSHYAKNLLFVNGVRIVLRSPLRFEKLHRQIQRALSKSSVMTPPAVNPRTFPALLPKAHATIDKYVWYALLGTLVAGGGYILYTMFRGKRKKKTDNRSERQTERRAEPERHEPATVEEVARTPDLEIADPTIQPKPQPKKQPPRVETKIETKEVDTPTIEPTQNDPDADLSHEKLFESYQKSCSPQAPRFCGESEQRGAAVVVPKDECARAERDLKRKGEKVSELQVRRPGRKELLFNIESKKWPSSQCCNPFFLMEAQTQSQPPTRFLAFEEAKTLYCGAKSPPNYKRNKSQNGIAQTSPIDELIQHMETRKSWLEQKLKTPDKSQDLYVAAKDQLDICLKTVKHQQEKQIALKRKSAGKHTIRRNHTELRGHMQDVYEIRLEYTPSKGPSRIPPPPTVSIAEEKAEGKIGRELLLRTIKNSEFHICDTQVERGPESRHSVDILSTRADEFKKAVSGETSIEEGKR